MMEKGKVINYVDVHIRMLYLAKYIYIYVVCIIFTFILFSEMMFKKQLNYIFTVWLGIWFYFSIFAVKQLQHFELVTAKLKVNVGFFFYWFFIELFKTFNLKLKRMIVCVIFFVFINLKCCNWFTTNKVE